MFKTVWFDDNLNTKILKDATAAVQADRAIALGGQCRQRVSGLHDLYNQNQADDNIDGDLGTPHRFQRRPDRGRPRQG